MNTWETIIPEVPPSASMLRHLGQVSLRDVRVKWYTHLKHAFETLPKAKGRRRLEVTFIQEYVCDTQDLRERALVCIAQQLMEHPEIRQHYSKGRRTGEGFFSTRPGLGILGGDTPEWLDLHVQGIFGAEVDQTVIRIEEAPDTIKTEMEQVCEHLEALDRSLRALTGNFGRIDGEMDRHYATEAAKTLLARPQPRAYQLWKRGLLVYDTPASLAGDVDMVATTKKGVD